MSVQSTDIKEQNKYHTNRYTFLVNYPDKTEPVTAEFVFKITSKLDVLSEKTNKAASFGTDKQQYNLDATTKLRSASLLIKNIVEEAHIDAPKAGNEYTVTSNIS
jgi:hypothetical protein